MVRQFGLNIWFCCHRTCEYAKIRLRKCVQIAFNVEEKCLGDSFFVFPLYIFFILRYNIDHDRFSKGHKEKDNFSLLEIYF